MMERIISTLAILFPRQYKKILFGSPEKPTRLANSIHFLLDRLPVKNLPVLSCGGVLKGYRMKIDWRRHRSFIYGTWEPGVVEAVSRAVSQGNVVMDIGSHIGFYTLLLSKLVGRDGMVIAFEPMPGNFTILEENINLNRRYSGFKAVNKAVLDRSLDEIKLTVPCDQASSLSNSPWGSLFFHSSGETMIVETVSIDDFTQELGLPVHFIKMDAEGAEELILKGALKTIERNRPTMLIELHHPQGYEANNPVVALLSELNYEIEWLDRFPLTSHIMARPI